jgi:DNA-binding NtrC family response regulator
MSGARQVQGRSKSILLIEDQEHWRDVNAAVLERAGYVVLCAKDAAEACEIWNRDQAFIEMIIADIVLPGRTGPEIAVQFRKSNPGLKVLFTTRTAYQTRIETEHLVRGAKFLRKPFTTKALIESVHKELGAPQPQAPEPAKVSIAKAIARPVHA